MIDPPGGEAKPPADYIDTYLERAATMLRILNRLEAAVDVELNQPGDNPADTDGEHLEKLVKLGGVLARISGLSYEIYADISTVTGVPLELDAGDADIETALPPAALPNPAELNAEPAPRSLRLRGRRSYAVRQVSEPVADRSAVERSDETAEKVNAPGPAEEKAEVQTPLSRRIIDLVPVPEVPGVDQADAIKVEIVADNELRIGTKPVLLGEHELLLFNVLLLAQGEPRSEDELRESGFQPEAASEIATGRIFKMAVHRLNRQLHYASDVRGLIEKTDQPQVTHTTYNYALSPRLVISDHRGKPAEAEAEITPPSKPARHSATPGPAEEKAEVQTPLARRIIDLALMPKVPAVDKAEAIKAKIVADNELKVGNKPVLLRQRELLLFNVLLLLRDETRSLNELREGGFQPDGSGEQVTDRTFMTTMHILSRHLNNVTDSEIIMQIRRGGRPTLYALNPRLVLSDQRRELSEDENTSQDKPDASQPPTVSRRVQKALDKEPGPIAGYRREPLEPKPFLEHKRRTPGANHGH